jgi:hypothetical protein
MATSHFSTFLAEATVPEFDTGCPLTADCLYVSWCHAGDRHKTRHHSQSSSALQRRGRSRQPASDGGPGGRGLYARQLPDRCLIMSMHPAVRTTKHRDTIEGDIRGLNHPRRPCTLLQHRGVAHNSVIRQLWLPGRTR